jgi:hypothetical protein
MHRALANKRAADSRALALLPTIRKLMAAGFVSQRGLANELNRRGIPAAGGGRWHRTAVTRMLTRLGHLVSVKGRHQQWVGNQAGRGRASWGPSPNNS